MRQASVFGLVSSLMLLVQAPRALADTQSYTTLTSVGIDNGNFAILSAADALPGEGCGAQASFPKTAMFALGNDYTKAMYSTAMAAFLGGKKVHLFMNGCHPLGFSLLTRIEILNP